MCERTLSGDPGQPDAEPGVSAVSGHPGEHGAAGREDEVRRFYCLQLEVHTDASVHVSAVSLLQVQQLFGPVTGFCLSQGSVSE